MSIRYFVFLCFLLHSRVSCYNATTGAIPLINNSHCALMETVMKTVIYPSDWCVFILLEHLDCPLHLEKNTMVTVSLESMFNGFVSEAQDKFYCDKSLALLDDWKVFRDFIGNRNLTKKFNPYNRLAIFSRHNSTDHGQLFNEEHMKQIYLGALHIYYGRIITDTSYELQDVLTDAKIEFSSQNNLETAIRSIRNLLIHPLFDTNSGHNQVNVSLYHCDPFVIRLDDKMTLNR